MRFRIRMGIKEQLGLLVSFAALLGLGILSAVTYFNTYNTILDLRGERLAVMAQLKSSQVSQSVRALINQVFVIAYRDFFGQILYNYSNNITITADQVESLSTTIESSDDFIAAFIYDEHLTTIISSYTTQASNANITFSMDLLPGQGNDPTTSNVTLLALEGGALIGPKLSSDISQTLLYSLTIVVYGDVKEGEVLLFSDTKPVRGFLTVVCVGENLISILNDDTGMGEISRTELVRLAGSTVGFGTNSSNIMPINSNYTYAVPSTSCPTCFGVEYPIFDDVPIIRELFNKTSGSLINAYSSSGVSIGYAPVDLYIYRPWGILVSQTHQAVYRPLFRLRNILLISVFSIGAGVCVITIILSHWAVAPIRILQAATEKTTNSNISDKENFTDRRGFMKLLCLTRLKLMPHCSDKPTKTQPIEHPWSEVTLVEEEYTNSSVSYSDRKSTNKSTHGNDTPNVTSFLNLRPKKSIRTDRLNELDNISTIYPESRVNTDNTDISKHGRDHKSSISPSSEKLFNDSKTESSIADNNEQTDKFQNRNISSTSTGFYIPDKVIQKKRFIRDELTELTETFNQMTDELRKQYDTLDQRVKQRTAEIESAKTLAETANEAKTLFIANITNELRTPLNSILAMTAVSMSESDVDKVKSDLKVIYKSGELLLHLLTDLLTFSKNQFGKLELDETEFTINEIVSQIEAIFREQSVRFHINFQINVLSNNLNEVLLWGDLNRILQICINILSNAFKFTEIGGSVKVLISIDELTRTYSPAGNNRSHSRSSDDHKFRSGDWSKSVNGGSILMNNQQEGEGFGHRSRYLMGISNKQVNDSNLSSRQNIILKIDILDTGSGIPTELQSKIFEPFAYVNNSGDLASENEKCSPAVDEVKARGTGLGLSICKQLATLMNGTIRLHSEVGSGSTFSFKVPLKVAKKLHERNGSYNTAASSDTNSDSIVVNSSEDLGSENDLVGKPIRLVSSNNSPSGSLNPSLLKLNNNSLMHKSSRSSSLTPHFSSLINGHEPRTSDDLRVPSEKSLKNSNNGDIAYSNTGQVVKIDTNKSLQRKAAADSCILVVEDNKVNQEVMRRMLNLDGIKDVTIANNGLEAVEKVKLIKESNSHYDIIFMDIQMPVMDGREATRIIRNDLNYGHPIIAVSAYADSSNVTDCLAVGMNSFLDKPLRRLQLNEVLSEYGIDTKKKDKTKSTRRV